MNIAIPGADYIRILPELVLTACGILVMLLDPLLGPDRDRSPIGLLALAGALLATAASLLAAGYPGPAFSGMIRIDTFSVFFHVLIGIIAIVVILASFEYMRVQQIRAGEYYGLILLATVGMMLMSSAVELVLIFIALEISSIATYILAGFRRRVAISAESSLKYFLLGSFATAFFLYGVALMFGATGSTSVYVIANTLRSGPSTLAYAGMAMMFVGLGFKVASAPFHIWTPDVYEGAPAPVVALMSTGPKAAAFAVLLRVLFGSSAPGWFWLIWASAALSMTIGNLGALVQTNVKRMLAYSSIAHAGYLLVAFAAARDIGISAAIFYSAAYAAMNVGAFVVVSHFANLGERYVTIDDYSGLGRRAPALAAMLTVFLLSLIGIPITGGFLAKFYIFQAAMQSHLVGLTIIGVINSAIASYYYLRVIVVMYMREPKGDVPCTPMAPALIVSLVACLLATIYLGIFPNRVLQLALQSAQELVK
ncbi:MAG TPA: NADH-quinone oxidoreductase subunit N [Terriglobales bacterium]|nr:NADH-quinone oxidoreductase subunit N [Terriglobales bacterium]